MPALQPKPAQRPPLRRVLPELLQARCARRLLPLIDGATRRAKGLIAAL
ncbi:MAG: hypothetical protein JWP47_3102 [Polaromonas sp.]|jgi:hypothetical protein|nr:hypothetical protein [Polaromonas sp.]